MISTKPVFDFIVILLNVITPSGSYDHNNHLLWWLMFSSIVFPLSVVWSVLSWSEALGSSI